MDTNCFGVARRCGAALAIVLATGFALAAGAEPEHGIAMYGTPALPEDFDHLPYADPDAPKGGRIVQGEVGSFDSLNPHILKGRVPWQLRYLAYESLMGRSWDEPFTLYGLLAESIEVPEDRSWVEFTLRPEARFSDGTPVSVEDVLWSYETLGTLGHPRYHAAWDQVARAEKVGERTVRFTFSEPNDELPLIMGLRPIMKKAQWEGKDFAQSGLDEIPITTAPYVVDDFEAGRFVSLRRDPDYWGKDLPLNRGQHNIDEIRMEFFGDETAMFEAFKAGILTLNRETSAEKWAKRYDFPAVRSGEVVLSAIPHQRPTGMFGLVMNTRIPPFDDWRVRQAMIEAFNFEFINQTLNGGVPPRITSYFANSALAMDHGPAEGRVAELLSAYEGELPEGAMEGYELPVSDGTQRNRANILKARDLLQEAGWSIGEDRVLRNASGEAFGFEILLDQGATETQQIVDLYAAALGRLGIRPQVTVVDSAQYAERTRAFDFGMAYYETGVSLSPGNEQKLYWGSEAAGEPGSRNWMGVRSAAVDGLIDTMLTSESEADFTAAVQALDRVLTAGRYVIPIWYRPESWIAHDASLHYPDTVPIYGDWIGFLPDVWWQDPR